MSSADISIKLKSFLSPLKANNIYKKAMLYLCNYDAPWKF